MFSSENLLFHQTISTLEMKPGVGVRWYLKEAILTDRAMYLYKAFLDGVTKSDYQYDANQRIQLQDLKARLLTKERKEQLEGELPQQFMSYDYYIEVANNLTKKAKLIACSSEDLQLEFFLCFNLISNFIVFDDIVTKQLKFVENLKGKLQNQSLNLVSDQNNKKRVENWVKNYSYKQPYSIINDRESVKSIQGLFIILQRYFRENVRVVNLTQNHMTDSAFATKIAPYLKDFGQLKVLKITNNDVGTDLIDNLAPLFEHIIHLEELDISKNMIGTQVNDKKDLSKLMDFFLFKFFTQLCKPKNLDMSFNQISDDCLRPLIKYTFANKGCLLSSFNLQGNRFTPYAQRTLLKGYAMCTFKDQLKFIFGGVSLTVDNMRAVQIQSDDRLTPKGQDTPVSITIQRKSNNFHGNYYVKPLPNTKEHKQELLQIRKQIQQIVTEKRDSIYIEELREFIRKVTRETPFEVPRHELEIIFNLIYEKLEVAISMSNIYYLEVLIDCLRLLNARNIPAEQAYFDLFSEAQHISVSLERIMNMEWYDDREMQKELFQKLKRAKQIGLRGELIDSARHFYLLGEKTFNEMMDRKELIEDDEDAIYDVAEEDRPYNVFDQRLDHYIELDGFQMGLTTTVEEHLALHPYNTDYLLVSNLNLNYVRRNLAEAKRFLRDEESYGYRNIFERAQVLLSNAGLASEDSITFNLARNDLNLRLTRLIFRYKNNLDQLFQFQEQSPQISSNFKKMMRNRRFPTVNQQAIEIMKNHILIREDAFDDNKDVVTVPLVQLDSFQAQFALAFSQRLKQLISIDVYQDRMNYIFQMQTFLEDFIIPYQKKDNKNDKNHDHDSELESQSTKKDDSKLEMYKLRVIATKELRNEYYVQIMRLIHHCLENIGAGQDHSKIQNLILLSSLISQYFAPSSIYIQKGIYHFYIQLNDIFENQSAQLTLWIERTLNNLKQALHPVDQQQQSVMTSSLLSDYQSIGSTDGLVRQTLEFVNWAPTVLEIESLLMGHSIRIQIELTDGSQVVEKVDVSTTVQHLVDKITAENPYLNKENESETFWLYRKIDPNQKSDNSIGPDSIEFDYPLAADQRILELIYNAEKQDVFSERLTDEFKNQRISFIIRKRLFPMMYLLKNFHLAHKHTMVVAFEQVRLDYVEYHILRDACDQVDIVYFAALLLKVRLQGFILSSKRFRVGPEIIKKNLEYAIPKDLIEVIGKKGSSDAKTEEKWATDIMVWFKKKDFLEQSIEEAQVRFLKGMASYQITFSSYYTLKRDSKHHSNCGHKPGAVSKVKFKRDDSSSENENSSDEDAKFKSRQIQKSQGSRKLTMPPPGVSTIQEASNEEEEELVSARIPKEDSEVSSQDTNEMIENFEHIFWNKFESDEIILVISIHGIQLMDANNRGNIVTKINYEDLLYVMGKDQCLKIGFIMHDIKQEMSEDESQTQSEGIEFNCGDCRTDAFCVSSLGMDARVIAEDIIAYAQLRLLEMTRNNSITLHREVNCEHRSDPGEQEYMDIMGKQKTGKRDINEMMDDADIDENDSEILGGLANFQNTQKQESAKPGDLKKLTLAEQFKADIQKQLGQNFCLKQDNVFCYRRKYPLAVKFQPREEKEEKLGDSIVTEQVDDKEIQVKETVLNPVVPQIKIDAVSDKLKAYVGLNTKKEESSSSDEGKKQTSQHNSPPPIVGKVPPSDTQNLKLPQQLKPATQKWMEKAKTPKGVPNSSSMPNIPSAQTKAPPAPPKPVNVNNFMAQFSQMAGSASTQSFGANQPAMAKSDSISSIPSAISPTKVPQPRDSIHSSSQSSKKAVDFIGIQNKEQRKSGVDMLLSNALDDAPF